MLLNNSPGCLCADLPRCVRVCSTEIDEHVKFISSVGLVILRFTTEAKSEWQNLFILQSTGNKKNHISSPCTRIDAIHSATISLILHICQLCELFKSLDSGLISANCRFLDWIRSFQQINAATSKVLEKLSNLPRVRRFQFNIGFYYWLNGNVNGTIPFSQSMWLNTDKITIFRVTQKYSSLQVPIYGPLIRTWFERHSQHQNIFTHCPTFPPSPLQMRFKCRSGRTAKKNKHNSKKWNAIMRIQFCFQSLGSIPFGALKHFHRVTVSAQW